MKSLILLSILSRTLSMVLADDPQSCFHILETTPKSEIKKYSEMSFIETTNTALTADMFSCFLEKSRYNGGEKSNTEKSYDIYKKCIEYAKFTSTPIAIQQLNELIKLGLQPVYANYLRDGIKTYEIKHIEESLSYIADKMVISIEKSSEFKNYKKLILQKLEVEKRVKVEHVGYVQDAKGINNDEQNLVKVLAFSKNSGQSLQFIKISYNILFKYLGLLILLMFL
ncbi:uncharacterized protein LOC119599885 [Lucilia sericata]|uniref:uncharacterized protein LOC119599885 n=1 Tax=Lucilia sericata TaxID=13632 RepID=UPI0018A807AE|nr:uncharacterized protein LOC119599885 [Lucilia sericata]